MIGTKNGFQNISLWACTILIFAINGRGQSIQNFIENEPTGVEMLEKLGSERNLTPLEKLLSKHFKASFALDCRSLFATGSFKTQGEILPLTIVSKRPKYFFQSIYVNKTKIEAGYDGAGYWYVGPDLSDSDRSALNKAAFFMQADLGGLTWIYEREGVHSMRIVETRIFDGVACRAVSDDTPAGPMLYLIEGSNGRERGRVLELAVEDQKHTLKLIYQYDGVSGGQTDPRGYQLWLDGKIYAEASFTSIRRDQGVMPWSFRAP